MTLYFPMLSQNTVSQQRYERFPPYLNTVNTCNYVYTCTCSTNIQFSSRTTMIKHMIVM